MKGETTNLERTLRKIHDTLQTLHEILKPLLKHSLMERITQRLIPVATLLVLFYVTFYVPCQQNRMNVGIFLVEIYIDKRPNYEDLIALLRADNMGSTPVYLQQFGAIIELAPKDSSFGPMVIKGLIRKPRFISDHDTSTINITFNSGQLRLLFSDSLFSDLREKFYYKIGVETTNGRKLFDSRTFEFSKKKILIRRTS